MKILHCCLASFYIDNYGYQENILPALHKRDGHEVHIIASTETYIENKSIGYINAGSYLSDTNIEVDPKNWTVA
jgi:1,2-diacylglycerol 3-alpha-glucosyltransferase